MWISTAFASKSYDGHFITKDWQHMCGIWMKNDSYRPCEEVWIQYDENGNVTSGNKPFFDQNINGIITLWWWEKICVKKSKEREQLTDCDGTVFRTTDEGNFECITKDGVETCEKSPDNETWGQAQFQGKVLFETTSGSTKSGTITKHAVSWDASSIQFSNNAQCSINGKPVDCEETLNNVLSLFQVGLQFIYIIGIFCILFFIFTCVMYIHAGSNPIPNKIWWMLVIALVPFFGSIAYYFVIKRNFSNDNLAPNTNNNTIPENIPNTNSNI
jgi:hypothetical protein